MDDIKFMKDIDFVVYLKYSRLFYNS